MGKVTIGVPGAGDIETALHKIGDQVLSRLDNKESRNLSMLLCEEMLLHIFHIGGADIRISAGGVIRPYIVITAEGEADELFGLDKGRDRDDLQYEINRNILKQYDSFIDHRFIRNRNIYRIALTVNLTVVWFENRVYQRFTRELESALKLALVEKLQLMTFKYHNETPDGMLVSRMASDIQFIKYLLYDFSTFILFMIEDMVFTAVISCIRLPLMLAVYGVLLPLYFILIRIFAGQLQERKAFMRVKTENSDAMFKEMLSMDQMIRASGLQQAQTRRIGRSFREALKAAVLHDNVQLRFNSVVYGLTQGFRLVVMVMAVIFASRGYIEIGSVVLFLSLLDITITSTEKVLEMSPQITQCFDSLYSINELLSENDVEKNGTRTLPRPVKGEIVFKDVSFGYDADKPILDHVDLTFPARKTTALTGRSGSGKTTILNLILGLYQKDSGQLLIDGIDIDELDKNDYRHLIAVVLQTPLLFHASLWDNLTYGLNYCSTSQVMDVLDKVGLASLVRDNDDGFDMQVLEGGSNLSGGQRQRIAIARALLRKPDIIILDEATSALDTESEKEVQAVLESVMRTCTVIVSAHRLSTIKKADAVYEIRDGKAVRYDSYEQLLND